MITDETVKQLFQDHQSMLSEYWLDESPRPSQFFRGVTPRVWKNAYPANCRRHMLVFNTFNIIPKYCFDCYKILVGPRNVVELFKLMVIFEKLALPNDNTRKCMVEMRPQIEGTYKGYIYCQSLEEAKEVLDLTQKVISEEISIQVPVSLKRGCSEYAHAYPEYVTFEKGYKPTMKYKDEWQELEDRADKDNLAAHLKPTMLETYNRPGGINLQDAKAMLVWLKYAATIGDSSYMKITEQPIPKLQITPSRPPFQAVEDE